MKFYKPHIKGLIPMDFDSPTIYFCYGLNWTGCGDTQAEAYDHWMESLYENNRVKWYFVKLNLRLNQFLKTLEI